VHSRLAVIHRYYASHISGGGGDPVATLEQAVAAAEKAIALDPSNRRGHGNRGIAFRLRAAWEMGHGLDPSRSLDAALESLRRAAELVPDAGAFNDIGNAYTTRAGATAGRGGDPLADLAQALAHYDHALELVPDYGYAHANRGLAATDRARWELEHGRDPAASLQQAVASLERAVALLPQLEGTHTRLADALLVGAEHAIGRRGDAAPLLQRAGDQMQQAARINPRPGPETLLLQGTLSLLRGDLSAAAASLRAALARDPRLGPAHRRLVEAALRRAPAPAFAEAAAAARALLAARERDPRSWSTLAQVYRRRAEWARARGQDAAADVRQGLEAARRALAADPGLVAASEAERALSQAGGAVRASRR
jgi:serine/threonine-protein kinase